MNRRQLDKLGIPPHCVAQALTGIQLAAKKGDLKGKSLKKTLTQIANSPNDHLNHPYFHDLAQALLDGPPVADLDPIEYKTWGTDIDQSAHQQMHQACKVPNAVGAALMPDAHVGYGLPIGGVLATENAIIPYAVGVDIACRMKLSIIDMPTNSLTEKYNLFKTALEKGTRFGVGSVHEKPQQHDVMDKDWNICATTRKNKDKAYKQLGTSGSGNHFVEFGLLKLNHPDPQLNIQPGTYIALLSHSGSRGTGASVCSTYSQIARQKLPNQYDDLRYLAWLSMDSEEGQEYFAAMNLMGDYAAANHAVIHKLVTKHLGAQVIAGVENHHNFAWLENHFGKDVIVHRKGATPAGEGVLGVIPGSMSAPAFVVRGKGQPDSLHSASHGAGRAMSRKKAKDNFNFKREQKRLQDLGIKILAAGADEVPQVYKDIHQVMDAQQDLVEPIAKFQPKIVMMCGDGSRAED